MGTRFVARIAVCVLVSSQAGVAVAVGAAQYKLGTFEKEGRRFVGVVVRDSAVLDLAAANGGRPHDMKELIEQYEQGLRQKIAALVAAEGQGGAKAHVHALKDLKVLPPIMYPTTMLNTAVNYVEHGREMSQVPAVSSATGGDEPGKALPGTRSAPGIWERSESDTRWNPYMFLKASSAVIADGETVRLPVGRTQIDWECELAVVIGKPAARVTSAEAGSYIFGYTIENDVSDRGGRGDSRSGGSDWLVGKSHDTFAPLGPFIVPKEFVADPRNVAVRFVLNGETMQQGSTSAMIHDVFEQVQYASNIMTLRPGDVIATGTPPGVGSGRKPPIYLKAGDRMACTYDGVGTLRNDVSK
ncbi:MAG TPA: fumarylacetoacetate hydrolase family protein [Steroidobacteraceae bacterium]|nr:fumarylacetoacetate hydrolase family protein [Steroidobacteraceae bacterium]